MRFFLFSFISYYIFLFLFSFFNSFSYFFSFFSIFVCCWVRETGEQEGSQGLLLRKNKALRYRVPDFRCSGRKPVSSGLRLGGTVFIHCHSLQQPMVQELRCSQSPGQGVLVAEGWSFRVTSDHLWKPGLFYTDFVGDELKKIQNYSSVSCILGSAAYSLLAQGWITPTWLQRFASKNIIRFHANFFWGSPS